MNLFRNRKVFSIAVVVGIATIFVWIFFANVFPKGYIVSAADDAFFFDMKGAARSYFYTWGNSLGNGSGQESMIQAVLPYQLIIVLVSLLRLPDNIFQTLCIPAFTLMASASFFWSLRILFPEDKKTAVRQVFFSLVYGLNGYTLYLFMHVFGYTFQQIFYLFIPVMMVLAYRIIEGSGSKKHLVGFVVASFLCSMGFNNPGFLVAFCLVLLFMSLFIICSNLRKGALYVQRSIIVYGVLFMTNIFWLLPYSTSVFSGASGLANSFDGWDIVSWIKWQSTHILDIIRFMPINTVGKFPDYVIRNTALRMLLTVLSFLPVMLVAAGLLRKPDHYRRRGLFFLSFFAVLIVAIAKFYGPLASLSVKFFSLPVVNATRSYDKFMVFLPFVVMMLIYVYFISSSRINQTIKWVAIAVLVVFPLPFYTGKLQQNVSFAFDQDKNYLTATYSYLVKVPDDYSEASHIVNTESPYEFKVQYLPYGCINSPGWSQYPKWKFIGNDVTTKLFRKPVQTPSSFLNIGRFNYGETFATYPRPEWIMRLMGLMNDSYLVFNKDVDEKFLGDANDKISQLEDGGVIMPVFKKDYINLYTIDETYFLPLFYVPKDVVYADIGYDRYPDLLSKEDFSPRSLYVLGNEEMNKGFFDRYVETTKDDNAAAIALHKTTLIVSTDKATDAPSLSATQQPTSLMTPGLIAFHKVNPIKYVITVSHAQKDFPLVFSETYDAKWKLYARPQNIVSAHAPSLPNTQDRFSITASDKQTLIDEGLLAYDGLRYISKNFKGTIQNDNIPSGHFYETYFPSNNTLEIPAQYHFMANGYSNGWVVTTSDICGKSIICTRNQDGTYNFNLVVEYYPQRLFYLGMMLTGVAFLGFFGFLGCNYWAKQRKNSKPTTTKE
ncbi:MAG: hypothetical protein V1907_04135 [Candidatus Kerfeldbacteria bacterium]